MSQARFLLTGDTSLAVEFGNAISKELNAKVHALNHALKGSGISGIAETVPTYRSLLIHYDPEIILYDELVEKLDGLLADLANTALPPSEVLEIPVLYGGEAGPDLAFVAEHHNMTAEEVIKIHTSVEYLVYMLGFTPGFTYLGGMSEKIATPRLKTPRVSIPAGSVGIAGAQTGIYPIDSPGGWQLIGRTPVRIYDGGRDEPILPKAGMYLKFYPIGQDEYEKIAKAEAAGGYSCRRHPKEAAGT